MKLLARITGGNKSTIKGHISLQIHDDGAPADYAGKFVRYRNIRVEKLGAEADQKTPPGSLHARANFSIELVPPVRACSECRAVILSNLMIKRPLLRVLSLMAGWAGGGVFSCPVHR